MHGVETGIVRQLPGRARVIANRAFTETIPRQANGYGHLPGEDAAAEEVPASPPRPASRSSTPPTASHARSHRQNAGVAFASSGAGGT